MNGVGLSFDIDYSEFERRLQLAIAGVSEGTEEAIVEACEDIRQKSLEQVPRKTNTLADSFFYDVKVDSLGVIAKIGYGGNGDPINPSTGQPASEYMVAVHEDLEAVHPIGKAKFLEDPLNDFSQEFLPNSAAIIGRKLEG